MIAELLASKKDQLAFIKTCRAFQEPGLRGLYAHVQVDAFEADEDCILATLFHRPDLTKHIRSYSGPLHIFLHPSAPVWQEIINLGSKPVPPEDAPEGYFPIIFEHAKGIRELEILRYSPGTFGERTSAMLCQLPLTKLYIRQGTETMPLTRILRALPSIQHLQLRGVYGDWDVEELASEDLPNLQSLAAPVRPSKLLVPGRPIDSIMIDFSGYGDQVDEDFWLKVSQSSARVVKLDLLPRRSDQELERAVAYLPGIRHLRLREQYFKVPEIIQAISHFPDLDVLDLSIGHESPYLGSPHISFSYDFSEWDRHIPKVFESSSTLWEVNVWRYKSFHRDECTNSAVQ